MEGQTIDGRDTGQVGGITDALRDQQRGEGEAGDSVVEQVAPGVLRDPVERRDVVADPVRENSTDAGWR
jgi:hypothetical protein